MNTRRWLLPFTHGVDMQAIDSVVSLAESAGTMLVALSLVSVPEARRSRGARLEEYHEVFTEDAFESIATLVHDLSCDNMILVSNGKYDALLHGYELKHMLVEPPGSFILLRLPTPPERSHLGARFLSWLRQRLRQQDESRQVGEPEADDHAQPEWRSLSESELVPGKERS